MIQLVSSKYGVKSTSGLYRVMIQQPHDVKKNDVVLTSMRRDYVASTSKRRHFLLQKPTGDDHNDKNFRTEPFQEKTQVDFLINFTVQQLIFMYRLFTIVITIVIFAVECS